MTTPQLIGGLGTTELVLIVLVILLLFGASKLPELARGSGRALRIFKAETKGLADDDKPADDDTPDDPRELEARRQEQLRSDAERSAREQGEPNT